MKFKLFSQIFCHLFVFISLFILLVFAIFVTIVLCFTLAEPTLEQPFLHFSISISKDFNSLKLGVKVSKPGLDLATDKSLVLASHCF